MGLPGSWKRPLGGAPGRFGWDSNVIIISLTAASIESFLCAKWLVSPSPQYNPMSRQC